MLTPGAVPSLQNVIPLGEGEVDTPQDPEMQLQEQEKRIEISCALAAEASRRGRMLSGEERGGSEGRILQIPGRMMCQEGSRVKAGADLAAWQERGQSWDRASLGGGRGDATHWDSSCHAWGCLPRDPGMEQRFQPGTDSSASLGAFARVGVPGWVA